MKYSGQEENIIIADSLEGLTYRQKRAFLCAVGQKRDEHIKYEQFLIKSLGGGVYNKLKTLFRDSSYRSRVLEGLEDRGIFCVALECPGYPEDLASIPAPPLVLYCKGKTRLLGERRFAIVGSRRTPSSSLAATKKIAAQLSEKFVIVTGVAEGADSAAMEGAMDSGRLICVFPGGLDYVSCQFNAAAIMEAEERGLVISEWPPATAIKKYMFAVRNRIIAGLSSGVLVAGAPGRSGALITAAYAENYGREVFAFPYSLGVAAGEGNNALIRKGATLCRNVLDIFASFGVEYKTEAENLTPSERAAVQFLKDSGESHIEDIAAKLGIKVFSAAALLSALELKGLVSKCGGNRYCAV